MEHPEASGSRAATAARGLVVPSEARSLGAVRRYVVGACVALGWDGHADTVALLASEAATNAVVHADGEEIRVRVVERGVRLRVEVFDDSAVLPMPRRAEAGAESGRGLALIEALAVRWDVDGRPDGKTFWFEIAR